MPYFTLTYANGLGFHEHINENGRINPLDMKEFTSNTFRQPAAVPLDEETHGGDDVGVYAIGAHSHLFTGVYEQHYIAHAMMYATCLGPEGFLKAATCDSTAVKFSIALIAAQIFVLMFFLA